MSDYQTCNKCGGRIVIRKMDGVATPIHLSGGCTGSTSSRSISTKEYVERYRNKRLNQAKKLVKSFTIPNASCPECGAKVFYYENEYGSKVFFDELGPPWPKHPCTDKSNKANGPRARQQKTQVSSDWKRFYLENVGNRDLKRGARITTWNGFYLNANGKIGPYREFYSLSRDHLKKNIVTELCYWQRKHSGVYKFSFIENDEYNNELIIEAFSKKEFDKFFKKGDLRKDLNRVGKRYLKSKIESKNIENHYVHKIPELTPISNPLGCPFCTGSFEDKEILRDHLHNHWRDEMDNTVFSKMSRSEWIDFVMENIESDQDG